MNSARTGTDFNASCSGNKKIVVSEGSSTAQSQAQKEKDRAQQKLASDMSAAGLEGSSTAQSQAQKERAVSREGQSTPKAPQRYFQLAQSKAEHLSSSTALSQAQKERAVV